MKKYEFKYLKDPSEEVLNVFGAAGWRIAAGHFEQSSNGYGAPFTNPIIVMEREIIDESETFSMEHAVRNGIRDGFTTWVDSLSAASVMEIFGGDR